VHGDPVNNLDPSGKWSLGGLSSSIGIGGNLNGLSIAASYVARQGVISGVQTGIEFAILKLLFPGEPFDFAKRFEENFLINLATGGLGNFWLRNLVDTAVSTIIDVANGKDLSTSLAINFAAAFGAEGLVNAGGSIVKRYGRQGAETLEDVGVSVSKGLLPSNPISRAHGVRKVTSLKRRFGIEDFRNAAFAEIDTGTGAVSSLQAVSGQRARRGFVSPPGTNGGISSRQRRFVTTLDDNLRNNRQFDSEVILLEQIANSIPTSASGRIRLFSEQPLCRSCNSVVDQFRSMFPGIEVIVSHGPVR
jgi:hypothetical protein